MGNSFESAFPREHLIKLLMFPPNGWCLRGSFLGLIFSSPPVHCWRVWGPSFQAQKDGLVFAAAGASRFPAVDARLVSRLNEQGSAIFIFFIF